MSEPTSAPTSTPDDAEIEPVMVTMQFEPSNPDGLLAVLSKYIVLTRGENGCRNVDLVASMTRPGHLLLIQKWDSIEDQLSHFRGPLMAEMAQEAMGFLASEPALDVHEAISMHDLN